MQTVETMKSKGQESLNRLVDLGKSQPPEVQTWGVTGGAAVVGALAVAAAAKGILAVVAVVANPPVALAVGALAGGAVGWSFMQKSQPTAESNLVATPVSDNGAGNSDAPAMSAA
ncbi:MAG: hypothetical protein R3E79_47620 [Caldilineaceae bacterium]